MLNTRKYVALSNLSMVIPRSIHRKARIRWLLSGAPSFPAYVSMLLDQAPDALNASQLVATFGHQMIIKAHKGGRR